jgi:enterochelin esterase family protein
MGRSQPKLLTRAINQGTPLIDGDKAVFLWKGRRPPKLIGDFTEWEDGTPAEMTRIAPGVWTYELLVPSDAYIEYAFMDGIERFPDPFNIHKVLHGLGKANNFFYLPEGKPTPLAERKKGVSQGKLTRFICR